MLICPSTSFRKFERMVPARSIMPGGGLRDMGAEERDGGRVVEGLLPLKDEPFADRDLELEEAGRESSTP